MHLTSPAFFDGAPIPREYTCDGPNVSPPLRWAGAPRPAKSFVLLCDAPDGAFGLRRHWAVFDIPSYRNELVEGAGTPEGFEDFRHALNDFRRLGYDGPCPTHHSGPLHLRFRLFALNRAELPIRTHPSCAEVEQEAMRFALAHAVLTGVYQR